MCSAPWYWNTRWMSGVRRDQRQVAQEERDPDQALDAVLDQAAGWTPDVATLAMNSGSRMKMRDRHAERDAAA